MLYRYHRYDPLQPRVPKDHQGGGQWTREGDESVQPAFLPPPAWPIVLLEGIEAALGLFALLSIHNSRRRQAVIEFNAAEYRGKLGILSSRQPRLLDRDEVNEVCGRLEDVQKLTDKAATAAGKKGSYPRPADYGTAVHSILKTAINGPDPKKVIDENFRAEVSYLKDREETYGRKDSIRIDVFERVNDRTVCVYDIKTGRSGLSPKRIAEIATNVFGSYPDARRIVITEVRPSVAPQR